MNTIYLIAFNFRSIRPYQWARWEAFFDNTADVYHYNERNPQTAFKLP